MYSDMSKRRNSTPMEIASCRVTSVLPTPVGPANRKLPTGLRASPRPERAILMAAESASIALSCPKITSFRLRSRFLRISRSEVETFLAGMRAMRSEEHTSELQSRRDLVCRLLLEKKKKKAAEYAAVANETAQNVAYDLTKRA